LKKLECLYLYNVESKVKCLQVRLVADI
jgi:hypothetical protein